MVILQVAHLRIFRDSDFMMWSKHEAGSFTLEEVFEGVNLFRQRILTGDVVVQPEHQQRIGVREHAFIDRKFESGLIDTLKYRNNVSGYFAGKLLERREGPEKQFESARDSLLKLKRVRPFRIFVSGPGDAPDFRHRRKSVVQLRRVSSSLSRITPRDVNTHAAPSRRIFARHMILVIRARYVRCAHFSPCLLQLIEHF